MKKIIFICLFLILILFSLLYPAQIIEASKQGLLTWFEQILPALLPFTILSTLLLKSNFLKSFSNSGNLLAISITMCCGFVFGFPIGAKLAADFYKTNLLTEKQADILAVTANNFSPMYVCGFVLPALCSTNGILLKMLVTATYFLLYLFPLFLAVILLMKDTNICLIQNIQKKKLLAQSIALEKQTQDVTTLKPNKEKHIFQINMSLLDESIISGFQTLIRLCGYIVLFSIFAKIAKIMFPSSNLFLQILLGNLEITNGIQLLADRSSANSFPLKSTYIFAIQLLSFGGLSGIAQTNSIFADSGLSIYKYIIEKVTLSLLLTLLCVIYVSYFNRF